MNTKIIFTVFAALAAIAAVMKFTNNSSSRLLASDPVSASWVHWKQTNGKSYGTDTEESFRKGVFTTNYHRVNSWNVSGATSTLALNKFADLETSEFAAIYAGAKKSKFMKAKKAVKMNVASTPSSYDARTEGLVSSVKDQGQCGSCWAFSAVGAVEGARAKGGAELQQFAEQQVVDCDINDGNQGCNGGFMNRALTWIASNPLALESDYAYTAQDGTCQYPISTPGSISESGSVMADKDQLKSAIYSRGPVSVGIEADEYSFQLYNGGVITSGCGSSIDHGVTAVGYDSSNGEDYFIIKNSWGADWGMNGYVNIQHDQCGVIDEAVYAVM
jgi:C1A family cysteine protease